MATAAFGDAEVVLSPILHRLAPPGPADAGLVWAAAAPFGSAWRRCSVRLPASLWASGSGPVGGEWC
eukprot:13630485-Alexandrium_andersonii.AAC.1